MESQSRDKRFDCRRESLSPTREDGRSRVLYSRGTPLSTTPIFWGKSSENCLTPGLTVWTLVVECREPPHAGGVCRGSKLVRVQNEEMHTARKNIAGATDL